MTDAYWQECINCSIRWGVSKLFDRQRRGDKKSFYCPNGHPQAYTESEADRLRKALETSKQQNAMWQDDARQQRQRAEAAERSASAQRGVVTRLKNRAAAGVCPCCNRTFVNLQRHMAGKHPTFTTEEASA